ncbi:MAG: hypothetical protein ABI907_00300 [Ramlibacter sp.]
MGIAISGFNELFAPLQGFVRWLAGAAPVQARPVVQARAQAVHVAMPQRKPLRVVRVVDAFHAPAAAGRMVISGRMADVCAELDRLAALEAAAP